MSLGLTQSEFGENINKAFTTIANWENGRRTPTESILINLISLYRLDNNYFNIK